MKLLGNLEEQRIDKTEMEHPIMNRTIRISIVAFAAILLSGCLDKKYEQGERQLKQPINCATAGSNRLRSSGRGGLSWSSWLSGVSSCAPLMGIPDRVDCQMPTATPAPITTVPINHVLCCIQG